MQGMNIFKANPVIIEKLKTSGHLIKFSEFVHSYPHCWRSKTPLIFRTTAQWFLGIDLEKSEIRKNTLKAMDEVQFFPGWGKARFQAMMENRPDWCLSRQRIWGVPIPMLHNLKHNKVLHEEVGILTIKTLEVPFVPKDERISIEELGPQFVRIVANYGFMEFPKMKHILDACRHKGLHFSASETTFVLGRETILPKGHLKMAIWKEKLFAIMSKNATSATDFFKIPTNRVVELGPQLVL